MSLGSQFSTTRPSLMLPNNDPEQDLSIIASHSCKMLIIHNNAQFVKILGPLQQDFSCPNIKGFHG